MPRTCRFVGWKWRSDETREGGEAERAIGQYVQLLGTRQTTLIEYAQPKNWHNNSEKTFHLHAALGQSFDLGMIFGT